VRYICRILKKRILIVFLKMSRKKLSKSIMSHYDRVKLLPNDLPTLNQELDSTIDDLDSKLSTVLLKQEYEYLQSYNMMVLRKEKDLRALIYEFMAKNSDQSIKDQRIEALENTLA